jgi:hypothetical protein
MRYAMLDPLLKELAQEGRIRPINLRDIINNRIKQRSLNVDLTIDTIGGILWRI